MNELALRQQSEELKTLVEERKALQKTELETLQRSRADATHQTEMQKLEREHAEAKHERALKLQALRHQHRMAKQRLLHDHNKEMVLLRKNYPIELTRQRAAKKAEEERQAQRKRTRRRVMEALLKVLSTPLEWHEDERGNLIGRRNIE